MARPKLDDPTVPIAFRMKRSAWNAWQAEAGRQGIKAQHLLRDINEQLAKGFDAQTDFETTLQKFNEMVQPDPERIEKLRQAVTKPLQRDTVEPRDSRRRSK
jgi:hypothetical protein